MRKILLILGLCLIVNAAAVSLDQLKLPPGFSVELYASNVKDAREMALGHKGTVFVGSTKAGKVYAITPDYPHRIIVIASRLNYPAGVAFYKGALYVAEINRIIRFDDIENHLDHPLPPTEISTDFPAHSHHGLKFLGFSPDGWLFVTVGLPCDICLPSDPRLGTIMRMKPDGSDPQIYVKGIRNSMGFAWDPQTQQLWFTDNGSDSMGDFLPPDRLNTTSQAGLDFGFPYYEGKDQNGHIIHTSFSTLRSTKSIAWPSYTLPPHSAALGMVFYTGRMFPARYHHQIFIAEHGSWVPKNKVGYRVSLVTLRNNKVMAYQPFMTGWLNNNEISGRPVALLVLPDGSLLVSDDFAGVIYRVTYKSPQQK